MQTMKTLAMSALRGFSFFAFVLCVHPWLLSHASAASVVLPEGLADAAGRTGYFASASGGIEAIDLASGKMLWQTHEAQRPLLLDGDCLLAQAGTKRNRLRILRFDPKHKGEC